MLVFCPWKVTQTFVRKILHHIFKVFSLQGLSETSRVLGLLSDCSVVIELTADRAARRPLHQDPDPRQICQDPQVYKECLVKSQFTCCM